MQQQQQQKTTHGDESATDNKKITKPAWTHQRSEARERQMNVLTYTIRLLLAAVITYSGVCVIIAPLHIIFREPRGVAAAGAASELTLHASLPLFLFCFFCFFYILPVYLYSKGQGMGALLLHYASTEKMK